MARRDFKEKAIDFCKKGMSYSQIREKVLVSKSSLSLWLRDYPLSAGQQNQLKFKNQQRIEKHRATMLQKRNERLDKVYKIVRDKLGSLTDREFFIAGLFLYWGEGSKGNMYELAVSNTDPAMLRFFVKWFKCLGVSKDKIRVTLHIYADMEAKKYLEIWSKQIKLPLTAFTQPYVKSSNFRDINYKTGFNYGTCMLRVYGRDIAEPIHMAIRLLQREMFLRA